MNTKILTNYVGKVIGNRVLVLCLADNGDKIQVPHVNMIKKGGLSLVPFTIKKTPKNGLRYLTQEEIACFLTGQGIDGQKLETPAEMEARHKKEHEELMKDPKYKELIDELQKEMKG